ncbi:MAG TPA: D-amino-acid transaminase [Chloroflexi bacterium]|nr:MAG: D-amino-acid transaminase [Anaerolineaceae bacterium 4572_5.2]HEY84061.1 D-amino-acid transaminase [Chloroflexota bacterium]
MAHPDIVYFNTQYLSKADVKISPDDRGFLFADGVYEVIRAYKGQFFRMDLHLKRLARSLRELKIDGPSMGSIAEISDMLIQRNNLKDSDAAIYIQITRGAAPRKHAFPKSAPSPTVYLNAYTIQPPVEAWEKGAKAITTPDIRWTRCDIKSVSLLPNVMASQAAAEAGAKDAIFIRDGFVTEGAHTNVCAVFNGHLQTHPTNNYILPGVTREVVLSLCAKLNLPVNETPIPAKSLPRADEIMLLGTSTEVMPIVQVDNWQTGNGKPGPITRKLQKAFRQLRECSAQ